MARPKLGEKKKTNRVGVFLTADEYEQIVAKAESASLTPADFLRQTGLNKRIIAPPPEANREALLELNAIGRNLNQLLILMRVGEVTSEKGLENRIERTAQLLRQVAKELILRPSQTD